MDQKGPTHAPFSERMSSNPTKLEDAMGACAIAALGTSVAKRRLPGKQPVIRRSPSRSTRFHVASLPLGGCLATRLPDLEEDARRRTISSLVFDPASWALARTAC